MYVADYGVLDSTDHSNRTDVTYIHRGNFSRRSAFVILVTFQPTHSDQHSHPHTLCTLERQCLTMRDKFCSRFMYTTEKLVLLDAPHCGWNLKGYVWICSFCRAVKPNEYNMYGRCYIAMC